MKKACVCMHVYMYVCMYVCMYVVCMYVWAQIDAKKSHWCIRGLTVSISTANIYLLQSKMSCRGICERVVFFKSIVATSIGGNGTFLFVLVWLINILGGILLFSFTWWILQNNLLYASLTFTPSTCHHNPLLPLLIFLAGNYRDNISCLWKYAFRTQC